MKVTKVLEINGSLDVLQDNIERNIPSFVVGKEKKVNIKKSNSNLLQHYLAGCKRGILQSFVKMQIE